MSQRRIPGRSSSAAAARAILLATTLALAALVARSTLRTPAPPSSALADASALVQTDPSPPRPVYLPRLDAAPPPDLAVEGQVGGATWAVAARGDTAYVGIGPRIVAWDLRPTDRGDAPTELAKSAVLGRAVRDLVLDGDRLYAALGGAGVAVYDVADPARIVLTAERDLPGESGSLVLAAGRLYVALGRRGIVVLDAASPTLDELGAWQAPPDGDDPAKVFDIALHGPLAYAAVETHGLLVLDVADPARIAVVGEDAAHGVARRVTRVGETAWVAADNGEVHVYDLRAPRQPRSFLQISYPGIDALEASTAGFAVDGPLIAVSAGVLDVWDVANPFLPLPMRAKTTLAVARHGEGMGDGVAWSRGRIIVAAGVDGHAYVVDGAGASTLDVVFRLSGIGAPTWPTLFGAPDGRTMFSRDHRFDVSDPSAPRAVGANPMVEPSRREGGRFQGVSQRAVAVDDRTVYGAGGDAWNLVVAHDLTDASRPQLKYTLRDPEAGVKYAMGGIDGWASDVVAVAGTRIVMAGGFPVSGCPVLAVASTNITNIQQPGLSPGSLFAVRGFPFVLGRHHQMEPAPRANYGAIALSEDGRVAVGVDAGRHCDTVSAGWGGIETFDVSDPAQPRLGHRIGTPFEQNDVVIHGPHAFVAAGKGGLRVYNIADVDALREVGAWDEGDEQAVAVAMAWPHVLLARSERLDLVDVRDPGHPTWLTSVGVPGVVKALRLYRGRAWVLTEDAGLVGYGFRGVGP